MLGAELVAALKALRPSWEFWGVGGPRLRSCGLETRHDSGEMAVVGFAEALRKMGLLRRVFADLKAEVSTGTTQAVVLIDYPGFNLRLARLARRAGLRVIYYVSPQIWAWRPGRLRQIARLVDKMLVLFPFEVPLYEKAGVNVTWVGHPLVDRLQESAADSPLPAALAARADGPLVGLLPGSREREVRTLLPVMVRSLPRIRERVPGVRFALAQASSIPDALTGEFLRESSVPVTVVRDRTHDLMRRSSLLLVASGTATLEGALLGIPMVILYKLHPLSWWLGKLLVRIPWVGLVNILAGQELAPELLQGRANPGAIVEAAVPLLREEERRRRVQDELHRVAGLLGPGGAAERAAQEIVAFLEPAAGSPPS